MDKRTFIKAGLVGLGGVFVLPSLNSKKLVGKVFKQATIPEFKMTDLPYTFDALEPYIDAETMKLHYSGHFAEYTRNFNALVKSLGITGKNARTILAEVSNYPEEIRINGGG